MYTVLLVEDDSTNLMFETLILKSLDCNIDAAQNGTDATNMVQKKKYDVIFLDLGLPDMDGFTVAKNTRATEMNAKTPIAIVTGHDTEEYKQQAFAVGANEFITKPLLKDAVEKILKKYCENKIPH